MRYDDEALLRFAFLWLRFSLFGEPTVRAREGVLEAFRGSVDKRALFAARAESTGAGSTDEAAGEAGADASTAAAGAHVAGGVP